MSSSSAIASSRAGSGPARGPASRPYERLGDGGDPRWGSRIRHREETAAVGEGRTPGGGRLHEGRLGGPSPYASSEPPVRVPRREGVGLRPDLEPHVVHAGGQRLANRTPSGSRLHASTTRSSPRRPPRRGCRVRRRPRRGRPRRGGPGRPSRQRRGTPGRASGSAGRPGAVTALEVALLDEQARRLGHPVGVRRHRQLDALAGRVVVPGDERTTGLVAQLGAEEGVEGGHALTLRGRSGSGWPRGGSAVIASGP